MLQNHASGRNVPMKSPGRAVRAGSALRPAAVLFLGALLLTLPPRDASALGFEKGKLAGEVTGYGEANVTVPLRRDTPHEDPSGIIRAEGVLDVGKSFRLKLSPRLFYDGTVQEPKDANPLQSFSQVYPGKPLQIEAEEAYLEVDQAYWEFKGGIQKVQWGKLDEINPTDNLNPQDFSRFVLDKRVDRKIGVPMLKLDVFPPQWETFRIEAVWVPVFVPFRMARPGERWFPPIFYVGPSVDIPYPGTSLVVPVAVRERIPEPDLPARSFENSQAAMRVSKTVRNVDLALSYFYGFDTFTPVYRGEGWLDVSLSGFPPTPRVSYSIDLLPQFDKVHVWGLEVSSAIGAFTLRSEWAYFKGSYHSVSMKPEVLMESIPIPPLSELASRLVEDWIRTGQPRTVIRLDPELSLKRDAIRGGVGVDYLWKEHLFTAQILVEHIRNWDPRLLMDEFDVFGTLDFRFSFLDGALNAELAGMVNFSQESLLLAPEVSYKITPAVTGTARLVFIDGPFYSLIGQYTDNDQVQVRVRYSF